MKQEIPGTLIGYAKLTNSKLYVTILQCKEEKSFIYTVKQFKQAIKRYCAFYNAVVTSQSWNDIEHTVILSNNVQFKAILY